MPDNNTSEPLTTLDFVTRYPHKYWISNWAKDDAYPAGFRYKLLSVRAEPDDLIELMLVLEQPGGQKTVMKHLDVLPSAFDRTAQTFVEGLAEAYGLDFELLDLSSVRASEEFERVVSEAGWHEFEP
jgi:hypothetical protein